MTETEERETKGAGDGTGKVPIDVETISKLADEALELQLDTSTRAEIIAQVDALRGSLNMLVREDLGADGDAVVRGLLHTAHRLLVPEDAPTEWTPVFSAFAYVQEAASVARRLVRVRAERNGQQP